MTWRLFIVSGSASCMWVHVDHRLLVWGPSLKVVLVRHMSRYQNVVLTLTSSYHIGQYKSPGFNSSKKHNSAAKQIGLSHP